MSNSARLHEHLRRMRSRVAIRKWEIRQIDHAGGVWYHLQLLLARSRRALLISSEGADALQRAGFEPHPLGAKLEPPKALFVISEGMLPPGLVATEIPLQDARQILLATAAVLIPFR